MELATLCRRGSTTRLRPALILTRECHAVVSSCVLMLLSSFLLVIHPANDALAQTIGGQQSSATGPSVERPNTNRAEAVAPEHDPLARFDPDLRAKLMTPGDLTLRDSKLRDALLMISELWGVDLAFTKDISGDVNGVFKNRPLKEILDTILGINGYGYRPNGHGLLVQTLDDLGESNPAFRSVTLPLPITGGSDNQAVEQIVQGAQMFMSKQGKIKAIGATKSMIVIDYPDRVERVRTFINEIASTSAGVNGAGAGKELRRFQIRHVTAEEIKGVLEGVLGDGGTVASMDEENVIVVYGPPALVKLAEQMIKENDVPRPQVRITAYVYDISLEVTERFGINWHHMGQGPNLNDDGMSDDLFGFNSGLIATAEAAGDAAGGGELGGETTTAAAAGIQAGSMVIRSLGGNFSLDTTIQALDETRGARLLAAPHATVQHLQEATMKAVREVPFQQLTESTDGGAVGTTEFREAGITLVVTPYIGDDNTITMMVQPTFSVLAGFQDGNPIIDTREASTRVRVNNGQVIVIGGLRQKSEVETVNGIPYLMDWHYLGRLFRSHSTTLVESELIVFIKPEIVTPDFLGTAREEQAAAISETTLDRIPPAHDGPFIPDCKDPYCPYHNPRPPVYGEILKAESVCPHHQAPALGPQKMTFNNQRKAPRRHSGHATHLDHDGPHEAPHFARRSSPEDDSRHDTRSNGPRVTVAAANGGRINARVDGPRVDRGFRANGPLPQRSQHGQPSGVGGEASSRGARNSTRRDPRFDSPPTEAFVGAGASPPPQSTALVVGRPRLQRMPTIAVRHSMASEPARNSSRSSPSRRPGMERFPGIQVPRPATSNPLTQVVQPPALRNKGTHRDDGRNQSTAPTSPTSAKKPRNNTERERVFLRKFFTTERDAPWKRQLAKRPPESVY